MSELTTPDHPAAPAGGLPGVEALRRINDRLRRRNARRRERIEYLTSELALAEEDADEARGQLEDAVSWPKWAAACLKIIRKHSGYDGYDDASEGIDLPTELEETLGEYRQQARRKAVEARADRETARHRLEAEHYGTLAANLRVEVNDLRARIEAADRLSSAGTGDAGRKTFKIPADREHLIALAIKLAADGDTELLERFLTEIRNAAPTPPATPATAPVQAPAATGLDAGLRQTLTSAKDAIDRVRRGLREGCTYRDRLLSSGEMDALSDLIRAALDAPSSDRGGATAFVPLTLGDIATRIDNAIDGECDGLSIDEGEVRRIAAFALSGVEEGQEQRALVDRALDALSRIAPPTSATEA